MSKRRKGPKRIFKKRPAGSCDICGGAWSDTKPSDGYVFKRLEENIAAGKKPFLAMARACSDCRERAEQDPDWGESIANQIGSLAMVNPESN